MNITEIKEAIAALTLDERHALFEDLYAEYSLAFLAIAEPESNDTPSDD